MNFPFYIARRYIFSKKSTNAINIISGISVLGVAVATMAMVVTLSVFNGFSDLVASFFTAFDPQLKIVPVEGKTVAADDPRLIKIKTLDEVAVATECVEDQAMAVYHGRQAMVHVKGVEDNFDQLTHINSILYGDGTFELHAADLHYGVPGIQLADQLGMGISYSEPLQIYAPRREGQLDMSDPADGFVQDELYSPGVVFEVMQAKYDRNYILTSIGFARRIFDQQGMISSLELRLKQGCDFEAVKEKIKDIAGEKYQVMDRYEQQDDTFRIMKIEKLIAYIFLTFILMVACFNIIGSLSMLIIDKKDDVVTLRNLGATDRQITQVFLFEGRIISAIGAIIGILIGLLLCWIQQTFGIISLGSSEGAFVINAYPVSVHPLDIIIIFITVLAVGFLSVWYPVHYFSKRLLS
ncbi:FtsX-like permease family protein [uncultured Prevotella sp.]|uniref:FtsX-like permease family protein n=1 Tax=uncultured Prevotella sp. TaxID=159272 RepID=UPI00258604E6|nr:FtsX-like permease family protein [uncultured Prevotella sp.]